MKKNMITSDFSLKIVPFAVLLTLLSIQWPYFNPFSYLCDINQST